MINTFAPFYQQDLNLSRAQVGLFFTAFYIGMAGLSLVAGWLTDRIGVRGTTLMGHLVLGLFTMAAATAPTFHWAFSSFFLAGLGYSFLNPASTKGVMMWFQRDERATVMGVKQTGVPAGGVATALIGAPLVLYFGWRSTQAAFGAVNLFYGLFFWMFWRDPARGTNEGTQSGYSPPERKETLKKMQSLLIVSSGTALFLLGQMSLITYIPLYLTDTVRLSPYRASQSLAVTQIGAMLGRTGWGAVSDRIFYGRRRPVLVIIGGFSVAVSLGLSLLSSSASLSLLIPLLFLAGFCMIGYHGVSYSLIGEMAGAARAGTALGLMVTVNSVGTIICTPLFGYLVDVTGSYPVAWRSLSGALLLGTLAFLLFVKEGESADRVSDQAKPD